ncbi:MAG: hypothetical protein V3V01_14065, partial [Acidimicrobiales bacterium]
GGDALQRYDHKSKQIQLVSVWPEAYHDGNSAEVRFQWTYPIVFSPQDANVLYATGNKVFRSTDEGHSWDTISPDLTYADPDTMGVSGPLTMDTAGAEMYATIFSFIASAHRPKTLMTGSDDGLVHVSPDDGGEWADVTPPDLPKFSQVTMLAESPHNEGTVYLTAARHKMGDYGPYVYKTTDYGSSWARIDADLPSDDFCRVIREDPNREGLLYVGTETGLFVSFDDGARWQSLQANLPVTPVYDLVIKGTDLVVATHGRSFWILDDLTQLHQMQDDLVGADNHLLKPRDVVRVPPHLFAGFWGSPGGKSYHVTIGQNATFYVDEHDTGHKTKRVIDAGDDLEPGVRLTYYLSEAPAGKATLTIVDSEGNKVETFSSEIPELKDDREGLYITANAGMNSFQWPMRYPSGSKMVDSEFHERPLGPLARPGTYQAKLSVGEWSMTQSFELVKDPRITTSDDDLAEQFELLKTIQDKLSEIVEGVNDCRGLKQQLTAWSTRLADDDSASAVIAAAKDLTEKLDVVEAELVQVEFTSEGDSLNYREKLFEKLTALPPVVGSADKRPTTQSHAVYDKLAGQTNTQLAALAGLRDTELSQLNEKLTALGVGIIGV